MLYHCVAEYSQYSDFRSKTKNMWSPNVESKMSLTTNCLSPWCRVSTCQAAYVKAIIPGSTLGTRFIKTGVQETDQNGNLRVWQIFWAILTLDTPSLRHLDTSPFEAFRVDNLWDVAGSCRECSTRASAEGVQNAALVQTVAVVRNVGMRTVRRSCEVDYILSHIVSQFNSTLLLYYRMCTWVASLPCSCSSQSPCWIEKDHCQEGQGWSVEFVWMLVINYITCWIC